MIGIKEIAAYLPENKISNYDFLDKFGIDENFIKNKLGIEFRRKKAINQKSSDLCVEAFKKLEKKVNINKEEINCCVVITQNPDFNIPHTSAIVHKKLGLKENCACFDISLGCSGYVYGLSIIISFMKENNLKKGILFTADPYSEIIDENDKNTSLIFSDASTVTLIENNPKFYLKNSSFGTYGKEYEALIKKEHLHMNGRAVFNFIVKKIPEEIRRILHRNNLKNDDIDLYLLHPGSKYIIDTIALRLKINRRNIPYEIYNYGNTVSSSIPIMLENRLDNDNIKRILISGFGVGLSWATAILERNKEAYYNGK